MNESVLCKVFKNPFQFLPWHGQTNGKITKKAGQALITGFSQITPEA